eukprot:558005-Pleurochrysis_carterae.AAC.1
MQRETARVATRARRGRTQRRAHHASRSVFCMCKRGRGRGCWRESRCVSERGCVRERRCVRERGCVSVHAGVSTRAGECALAC